MIKRLAHVLWFVEDKLALALFFVAGFALGKADVFPYDNLESLVLGVFAAWIAVGVGRAALDEEDMGASEKFDPAKLQAIIKTIRDRVG